MAFVEKGELLIPDNVLEATGDYVSPEKAAQHSAESVWFREELKRVDEMLDLIFVKPGSKVFPISPRFYITRRSHHLPDQWWVIQDDDGTYCPPDMRHLNRFLEGDMSRNPRILEKMRKQRGEREERARRRKQELLDEFSEKLLERLDFEFGGRGVLIDANAKAKLGG